MRGAAIAVAFFFSRLLATVASPLPLPLALMTPDYKTRFVPHDRSKSVLLERGLRSNTVNGTELALRGARWTAEAIKERDFDVLSALLGYYNSADKHSNNLGHLAEKSANIREEDLQFQHDAVSEFTAYDTSLLGIRSTLDALGADRGLANYDKTNQLETILKGVVNAHKDALAAVSVMVYNIPGLGPILGPTVYEVKCILDDVLNAVENLTDEVINDLAPLLRGLVGRAES